MKIAGRTYLDLAKLRNIGVEQLPEVVLAARMYHLAHTHRALVTTGQCALWAHGYVSDPALPPITVAASSAYHPIVLPAVTIGTHTFAPMRVMRLFAFKGVGGVGIRRSGGGSVGGSFGG